jgi:hypothetical protein
VEGRYGAWAGIAIDGSERRLWVGSGPVRSRAARLLGSEFDLLRDAERIVDLDTEVANRAFEIDVPKRQLNGSEIASLLVDLSRLGAPHRMRSISRAIETGALDRAMDDAGVLSRRDVRRATQATWEEVLPAQAGHWLTSRGSLPGSAR